MRSPPSRRGTDAPHFKYRGGKAVLRRSIVRWAKMLGHVYVEPFAGRGNVFFLMERLASFREWVLNDLTTANFLRAISTYTGHALPSPNKEQTYALYKHSPDLAVLMEPVLTRCGGQFPKDSIVGVRKENIEEFRRRIIDAKHALKRARVTEHDGVDVIAKYSGSPKNFLYIDPPYLGSNVGIYNERSVDWPSMFDLLKGSKSPWLLSHYIHPLVLSHLGPPTAVIKGVFVSPIPGVKRRCEEGLWTNYKMTRPLILDFRDISRPVVQWSIDTLHSRRSISWEEWQAIVPRHWKPATVRTQFRALGLFPQHYFDGETLSVIGDSLPPERRTG